MCVHTCWCVQYAICPCSAAFIQLLAKIRYTFFNISFTAYNPADVLSNLFDQCSWINILYMQSHQPLRFWSSFPSLRYTVNACATNITPIMIYTRITESQSLDRKKCRSFAWSRLFHPSAWQNLCIWHISPKWRKKFDKKNFCRYWNYFCSVFAETKQEFLVEQRLIKFSKY